MAPRPSPALTVVGRKALRDCDDVLTRLHAMRLDADPDEHSEIDGRIDTALDRRNDITQPYRPHP